MSIYISSIQNTYGLLNSGVTNLFDNAYLSLEMFI